MRLRSASRTGGKQNKALRLFKQLEFIFRGADPLTSILSFRERRTTKSSGEGNSNAFSLGRDLSLEMQVRKLLRKLGAGKLAREIRVEWNPRMRSAAGRANFREKLISLNPLLCDHDLASVSRQSGSDIDRTLRHELAHLLAQFRVGRRRIAPHGSEWRKACCDLGIADEARCHNLPFASKSFPPRFVYRCPDCEQKFPRVRRIRRAIACLACCRKHNGGDFDPRFRLKLITTRQRCHPECERGISQKVIDHAIQLV
jgi:SprT protein